MEHFDSGRTFQKLEDLSDRVDKLEQTVEKFKPALIEAKNVRNIVYGMVAMILAFFLGTFLGLNTQRATQPILAVPPVMGVPK